VCAASTNTRRRKNRTEQFAPIADSLDLNERLHPDIVVLDEAQRIKNWSTRTAQAVKRLRSRYAFVLTGTPIENRIDELRSIVDFLDPALLGPLFRFNRDYYTFDDKGRPESATLAEALRPPCAVAWPAEIRSAVQALDASTIMSDLAIVLVVDKSGGYFFAYNRARGCRTGPGRTIAAPPAGTPATIRPRSWSEPGSAGVLPASYVRYNRDSLASSSRRRKLTYGRNSRQSQRDLTR